MLNTWYHFLIGKHILVHRFFFLVIIFEGFLAILDAGYHIFGHILTFFGLDTFQFFKCFSGSRKIPKQFQSFVVFLMKLENNIWQPLVIWKNLTGFLRISRKVLSLFWQKTRRAWFAWFYSVSAIYLVECSQLLKRCELFSCNSCLRNAPNF